MKKAGMRGSITAAETKLKGDQGGQSLVNQEETGK